MSAGMPEVINISETATFIADSSHVTKEIIIICVLPWPYPREDGTDNRSCVGGRSYLMYVFTPATSTLVAERRILSHSVYNCHSTVLCPSSRLTSQKGQYELAGSFQESLASRTEERVQFNS
jgi:hypothetical protein